MDETTPDLERRVGALEAADAIRALKHRYWRACDTKDPAAFRDCFVAEGADVDFGPMGRFDDADGITEVFRQVALARRADGRPVVLDMHHGMHPDIHVVDATHATGRWTLRFRQLNLVDDTETVAAIEYDDDYVVEDGRWRIRRSHTRTLWSLTRPLPPDADLHEGLT